jgi:hypothetical protein
MPQHSKRRPQFNSTDQPVPAADGRLVSAGRQLGEEGYSACVTPAR